MVVCIQALVAVFTLALMGNRRHQQGRNLSFPGQALDSGRTPGRRAKRCPALPTHGGQPETAGRHPEAQ